MRANRGDEGYEFAKHKVRGKFQPVFGSLAYMLTRSFRQCVNWSRGWGGRLRTPRPRRPHQPKSHPAIRNSNLNECCAKERGTGKDIVTSTNTRVECADIGGEGIPKLSEAKKPLQTTVQKPRRTEERKEKRLTNAVISKVATIPSPSQL